jgi:AcrR family transcriptional regulator
VLDKEIKSDPRSKRTRRLLQDALTDLMHKKKFHEISVQDITARAEINRATFYAHFVDKYELLNAQIRDSFQSLLDEKLPENPTFTIANLRILALTAHQFLAGFAGHCATAGPNSDSGLMVQQVQRQTQTVVLDWLKNTPNPPPISSLEVAAMVISWAIFGSILEVTWNSRKISAEQLTTQVLSLLEPGLRDYLVAESAAK